MRQHHNGHGQHGVHQAGPEDGHDHDGQQQAGQGQDDVHDAHHGDLKHATEVAGQQAQNGADHDRHRDHGDANCQRQARTMDQAREDVTANGVGAQQVGADEPPCAHAGGTRNTVLSVRSGL